MERRIQYAQTKDGARDGVPVVNTPMALATQGGPALSFLGGRRPT